MLEPRLHGDGGALGRRGRGHARTQTLQAAALVTLSQPTKLSHNTMIDINKMLMNQTYLSENRGENKIPILNIHNIFINNIIYLINIINVIIFNKYNYNQIFSYTKLK